MRFGSLFSGIGGIDLGLERAGMECRWQVEVEPYCLKVLAKHWPHVPRYGDIRELSGEELEPVDLIAGGFPCQDVSLAGKRAGLAGERSGLWFEFARLLRVLRPRYVLVENTPGLLSLGMGRVLGDLASLGYDAEWESLPAAAFGAPHIRERVFLVAYSNSIGRTPAPIFPRVATRATATQPGGALSAREWGGQPRQSASGRVRLVPDAGVLGVANGVPARVDRLRGLGNAVVPQVVEWIGRRILEVEATR